VRNRRRDAPAQARQGARQRSRCGGEKKLIEQAYTLGAQLGLSVWCEDEAGPFQAVPHPGASWQPREHPATQPHEYIRGGTTKILTLFHPASGRVRLQPATRGTNAVLLRPPDALQLRFGSWSFFPHVKQAKRKGLSYKVVRLPRVALDVDTPEDLARLVPQARGTSSYAVLEAMGLLPRLRTPRGLLGGGGAGTGLRPEGPSR
jgi:hypothetical protein